MASHYSQSFKTPSAIEQATLAELIPANEHLSRRVQQLLSENAELVDRLHAAAQAIDLDRESHRAALKLMEDAIESQKLAHQINRQLLGKIEEMERTHVALRNKETELRQSNVDLGDRIREGTLDLSERDERLRELTSKLSCVEQEERQRLARLLHDQIQQMLVAARLRIDLISTNAPVPIQAKLNSVLTMMNEVIEATRDLSVQLAPPLLHDQGLPAALEWLAGRMARMHSMRIETDLDAAANPPCANARDTLFHVAQELLLNVVKHSGAARASISLRKTETRFIVEVSDRGIGFDGESSIHAASFGLLQVRQRLNSSGGSLIIDSSAGQGARVVAELPVAATTDPRSE